ncbi:MAG: OmpA family protein [Georgfuchsia sp.]
MPLKKAGVAASESAQELVLDPDSTVFFEIGAADISTRSQEVLRSIARQLSSDRNINVQLIGRTDQLGSKEICVAIANKRMEAVEDALVKKGVKNRQIRKYARGCETTVDRPCSSEACKMQLRSVELKIIGKP